MVISWILNSLDKEIDDTVIHTETASEIWKEIKKRYGQASGTKDKWVKLEGDQRVHQFLAGLNDSYVGIRRNILMIKPPVDLDGVYSMLIHDEQQSDLQASIASFAFGVVSFSTTVGDQKSSYRQRVNFDSRKPNYSRRLNYSQSQYCKRSGHSIKKCHRLHGYPSNFQFNKGKKTATCVQGMQPFPQPQGQGDPSQNSTLPHYSSEIALHGFS
ncbi:uncharacterized protein LOC132032039 [Lycium ferocissimum]|uniref:uncharacterized protein LOC132032039 n=1 Tax=Lycium ferocissimum TaxID=112874 RepID=UPI0028151AEA|nr:uncharacterized protein LOC132032039 [Lycium ferocissimum]